MNIVDSSAWLSYFAGDENAKLFAKPIENVKQHSHFAKLENVKYFKKM